MTIKDVANARLSTGNISATIAGPIVMTPDPPIPANNLIPIRPDMVGDKPHPRSQILKNQQEIITTGYRPYSSENGPRKRGPMA
jgi:hypothetical protein